MKKITKLFTLIGVILVILGSAIFVKALADADWKFVNLAPNKLQTRIVDIEGEFDNISIKLETTDVEFALSTDGKNKILFTEREDELHTVNLDEDGLSIVAHREYNVVDSLFNFGSPKMIIYLVESEFENLDIIGDTSDVSISKDFSFNNIVIKTDTGDVASYAKAKELIDIETDTGDIKLSDVSTKNMSLNVHTGDVIVKSVSITESLIINVTTGDILLKDATSVDFKTKGNTGDIVMENLIVSNNINVFRTTGDINFNKVDAASLDIETDTGDVTGTLNSDKTFIVETRTGEEIYPKGTTGGKCNIKTSTGDIIISIAK